MADFDFNKEVVTVGMIRATDGYLKDTVPVKVSDHMFNGCLVKLSGNEWVEAKNSEVIAADVDLSTFGFIDDLNFRRHGDAYVKDQVVSATVAMRGLILNKAALTALKDDASGHEPVSDAALKALARSGLFKYTTLANDTTIF